MYKFNPFQPNSIVAPGLFAGRVDELRALDQGLFQTKNGNPWNFLIHGERGIGKSSLLFFINWVAQGKVQGWSGQPVNFVTVNVELEPSTTYPQIVRKIGSELANTLRKIESVRSAAKDAWDFLKGWEAFGIKYTSQSAISTEGAELVESLCSTIGQTMERLAGQTDGMLVLIDESDKPPVESNLGEFAKIFTERLTKSGCTNVALGLSGISTVLTKLKESHESSPRIFNMLLLEALTYEERKYVIQRGIEEANSKSDPKIKIAADAEDWICKYSEGYPHFVQQYAYSALDTDSDSQIDVNDVQTGAFKENGALDQLGARYFEDMYLDQIGSDEYRMVLQAMSLHPEEYMSRKEIKDKTELKETTLSNALATLKKRNIILAHREKAGLYKLPTSSFAAWIRARVERDKVKKQQQTFWRG